ncbi:MAG: hypothetical protein RL110_957 [Bacteroidota bacterium]
MPKLRFKLNIMRAFLLVLFSIMVFHSFSQQNVLSYAGNSGKECFYDVTQLTDGTFLVCGYAENLDWIDPQVPKIQLSTSNNIPNSLGTNRYGIILHLSSDLSNILEVVHFPQGKVEDVRFIKTNSLPYHPTGDLFISCNTADTYNNNGGYIIAKLNGNFINQTPTHTQWVQVVWAMSYAKEAHPWDVTSNGEIYYVSGEAHGYDWSAMYCLDHNGLRKPVEHWRTHWLTNNSEWKGTPASSNPLGSIDQVKYSGIVFKYQNRCELRSWTQAEFDQIMPDGNGGTRKGRWPADFLFNGPCDPANPSANSPGYNGYSPEACCPVWGASSIAIDRRNNHVYLGMNFKSYYNPGVTPDFEPAVLCFNDEGALQWWSRLYHEITPSGDTVGSIPDQYVDALAIDYANDLLVVGARAHGNNTENLWEGNTIVANPNAFGFQNQFTGTNGNIHESWLGKLTLTEGNLMHSTYVAEYAESTANFGAAHPDPNLDGWPNPNEGWPNVNTTRIAKNNMKVSSSGDVLIGGVGRRTITTANAYQKMVKPFWGGMSAWNSFVRVYNSSLNLPKYSSLIVGVWDTITQAGGGNTDIYGVYKTAQGVIAVGRHTADPATLVANGNSIPTVNVPNWGTPSPQSESAIIAYFKADNLYNSNDSIQPNASTDNFPKMPIEIYPNPGTNDLTINSPMMGEVRMIDLLGNSVLSGDKATSIYHLNTQNLPKGLYYILLGNRTLKWLKV